MIYGMKTKLKEIGECIDRVEKARRNDGPAAALLDAALAMGVAKGGIEHGNLTITLGLMAMNLKHLVENSDDSVSSLPTPEELHHRIDMAVDGARDILAQLQEAAACEDCRGSGIFLAHNRINDGAFEIECCGTCSLLAAGTQLDRDELAVKRLCLLLFGDIDKGVPAEDDSPIKPKEGT